MPPSCCARLSSTAVRAQAMRADRGTQNARKTRGALLALGSPSPCEQRARAPPPTAAANYGCARSAPRVLRGFRAPRSVHGPGTRTAVLETLAKRQGGTPCAPGSKPTHV
eukprot:14521865-Alexandrium_andersonii.AAC.1